MTEEDYEEMERAERQKHDDMLKEINKRNKDFLIYINYQMKNGISFEQICHNFDYYKAYDYNEIKKENAELKAKWEKQKEINKEYVDVVAQLKAFVWGCMHEKTYSQEELNKLMEL